MFEIQARLLARAVAIVGGEGRLASLLQVPEHSLRFWSEERARLPDHVFLAVVDLVLADDESRAAQDRRRDPRGDVDRPRNP